MLTRLSDGKEKCTLRNCSGLLIGARLILVKRARRVGTWNEFFME